MVSVRRTVAGAKRLARALPASLLAILLVFHGWLLYTSISTGRLLDADVAVRWVAGLALSGAFLALWRLGVPLVRGRKAVVLWALVVVLHAHAVASTPASLSDDTTGTQTIVALAVQFGGPLTAAFGLILLALFTRAAVGLARVRRAVLLTSDTLAHVRTGGLCFSGPRPPPSLA